MKVNFKRIIIKQNDEWVSNMIISLVQCKICLNILNDPYDCLCCNQTFCKKCITNYILSNKKCPYSTYFKSTLSDNKTICVNEKNQENKLLNDLRPCTSNINKLINSLSFSCENKKNGCNTELAIEDVNDHNKQCKFRVFPKNFKNNNALNSMELNNIDNIILSPSKDKLKFQDSCMSFKKIDVSDTTTTQQVSNIKIMEKIDKIFDMVTTMSIEQRQVNNTKLINKSPNRPIASYKQKTDLDNETPKFKAKQLKMSNSFKSNSLSSLTSLTSKMENITKKITAIERTLQAVSSLNIQEYSIIQDHDNNSSIFSTPSKPSINKNKNSQFTTSPQSLQNINDFSNHTIASNISFHLTNSALHKNFSRTTIKNDIKANNNKVLSQKTHDLPVMIPPKKDFPAKELFQPILDTSKLENIINNKDIEMKKYLDEKVMEVIKSYLNDLNLNQGSYFIELKELLSSLSVQINQKHSDKLP